MEKINITITGTGATITLTLKEKRDGKWAIKKLARKLTKKERHQAGRDERLEECWKILKVLKGEQDATLDSSWQMVAWAIVLAERQPALADALLEGA